jgi:hypothetical protein
VAAEFGWTVTRAGCQRDGLDAYAQVEVCNSRRGIRLSFIDFQTDADVEAEVRRQLAN